MTNLQHEMYKRQGITPDNKAGQGWEQFGGENMHISVGYGPILWGVDLGHDVWFKQLGAIRIDTPISHWELVDDTNQWVQLDVGRDGHVMAVNTANELFWRTGITAEDKDGEGWQQIDDGNAETLSVAICSTGQYWKVGLDFGLYFRTEVFYDDDVFGDAWERVNPDQQVSMVSCGGSGEVVVVEKDTTTVFEALEVSAQYPKGTSWAERENTHGSTAVYASVGEDGEVWVTTAEGTLECRAPGATSFTRPSGGNFKLVDAGHNQVYGVNQYDEVYQRTGVDAEHPCGRDWSFVPGAMVFVATSEQNIVWGIDDEADIWVLRAGELDIEPPVQNEDHGWILIPENELIQVDVGYNA